MDKMNKQSIIGMIILFLLMSANTFAYDVKVGGIYYNLDTKAKTAEVTCYKSDNTNSVAYTGAISIPSSIISNGISYKVVTIGKEAFRYCSDLVSITIPNSVRYINAFAFAECGLTSVIIPNSVVSINHNSFEGCNGLSIIEVNSGNSVYDSRNNCNAIINTTTNELIVGCKTTIIPNSVTSIGHSAFAYCKSLTSLDIPNSITTIGDGAFTWCSGLSGSLTIPNSVTSIGEAAFQGCSGLSGALKIPNSVSSIGAFAFSECSGFSGPLTIPSTITSIEECTFQACSGLTGSLSIPNSVESIGFNAFFNCNSIGSLTIPKYVKSIGEQAFSGCSGLTGSLTIPSSLTSIGERAFSNCGGIDNIYVETGNTVFDSRNNCNAIIKTSTNELVTGCKNTIIPNSVTSICDGAFSGRKGLTSLTIPNNVTNIGNQAFYECIDLTTIILPSSLISIGSMAFASCNSLTSITIPKNVISLGKESFWNCKNLAHVKSYIENPFNIDNVFYYISSSAKLEVPKGTKNKYLALSGWTKYFKEIVEFDDSPTTYTLSITASGNGSASYSGSTIRSKTSSFTVNAGTSATITFSPDNGYRIKSVKVNGSIVTVINNQYSISSICQDTTVEVEYTIINTGDIFEADGLFYKILSSHQVEITQNSKYQEYSGELRIPETVKYNGNEYVVVSIGRSAFNECKGFSGTLTIPNSVTSIGWAAFYGCSGFTGSLTIPNSVTTIDGYAFMDCSGFSGSLTISNSITSIEERTFSGCSGFIGSLTIPNSVTSIGLYAFYGCSGFTGSLTIPNSVISIKKCAFAGCSGFNGSLTIPSSILSIEESVFSDCSHFTGSLIIPNSVTSIGDFAFSGCRGFNGSLIISNSVKTIGEGVFFESGFTGSLTIPNSVTVIKKGAFMNCRGFTGSLIIPNSVTSIGESAFQWCTNLDGPLTIPNSVTFIGELAFVGCSQLKKVISEIENPFSIDNTVFKLDYDLHETLAVPQGTKSKYQALSGWSTYFKEIVESNANPITYTLSITATGNGSVSYSGSMIRDNTSSFTVAEGSSPLITFTPDNGYRIKSVKVNNSTVSVSDNQYTISSINANTMVSVEFEAIPVTYTLSITASGNGSASYDGTTIRSKTSSFTVNEGTTVKISITPDNGYRIKSVKENNTVVTSYVSNGIYTINSLSRNTTVEVEFEEILQAFSADDVNYTVVSVDERTIRLAKGSYGITLEVPAKVNYQNAEWTVTGIDNGALANNPDLAAIVWNPDVAFTEQVSNPNLLLYVNQTQYAPSSIKNVVVNGNATSITLTDAASGNNFHCPQAFTAQKISYTHNYSMKTGIGEAKGWETIALPFDVQKVTHESKGEIVSFANWRSGDSKRPFWLMQLSGNGWTMATSIKASTPYIISMPYNDEYKAGFLLNGRVTFSAENVNVAKTENLSTVNYSDRTFIPTFSSMEKNNDVLALNVVNDIERVTGGSTEGSTFERNLRPVHPFEAYMTSTSSTRSIGIDEGMATGIIELISALSDEGDLRIYNLNGQLIKIEEGRSLDEVMRELPAGVYIVNGKKMIIR